MFRNGYPRNISFVVLSMWWRSFLRDVFRLWSACDMLWGTGGICCGQHPWDILWVTCCGQHQKYMLWGTRVSPTTYASCSPQHIACSPQHVTHKGYVYPVDYTGHVVDNMLWNTLTYVVGVCCGIQLYVVDYPRHIVDI